MPKCEEEAVAMETEHVHKVRLHNTMYMYV